MEKFEELIKNPEFVEDYVYGDPEKFYFSRLNVNKLPEKLVFSICFGLDKNIIEECEDTVCDCIPIPEDDAKKKKYNLLNAELELLDISEFNRFLFHYAISLNKIDGYSKDQYLNNYNNRNVYSLNVSEMLLETMRCSNKQNINSELSFLTGRSFKLKLNDNTLSDFQKLLTTEYCRLGLDTELLTYQEAYDEIIENPDEDFMLEFQNECRYHPVKGIEDINLIPKEIIQFYADSHDKIVPVTLSQIKETIDGLSQSIEKAIPKKGAKPRTLFIQELVFHLVLLFNFKKYMEDKSTDSILNFKITSKCFRTIFDFLEYFGFIENATIVSDNEHKSSYIKSVYKRYSDHLNRFPFKNVILIDKIKKVRNGTAHFDEDESYHISDSNRNFKFLGFINDKYS